VGIQSKRERIDLIARFLDAHASGEPADAAFVSAFADRCFHDDFCFHYLQRWSEADAGDRAEMFQLLRDLLKAVASLDRFEGDRAQWTDESGKWLAAEELAGRLTPASGDASAYRRELHDRFFANLQRLRAERGLLTQRAFADACGLHQSQVSRMEKLRTENPTYLPRLAVRDKIARGLGVPLAELDQ